MNRYYEALTKRARVGHGAGDNDSAEGDGTCVHSANSVWSAFAIRRGLPNHAIPGVEFSFRLSSGAQNPPWSRPTTPATALRMSDGYKTCVFLTPLVDARSDGTTQSTPNLKDWRDPNAFRSEAPVQKGSTALQDEILRAQDGRNGLHYVGQS